MKLLKNISIRMLALSFLVFLLSPFLSYWYSLVVSTAILYFLEKKHIITYVVKKEKNESKK